MHHVLIIIRSEGGSGAAVVMLVLLFRSLYKAVGGSRIFSGGEEGFVVDSRGAGKVHCTVVALNCCFLDQPSLGRRR